MNGSIATAIARDGYHAAVDVHGRAASEIEALGGAAPLAAISRWSVLPKSAQTSPAAASA